MSLLLVVAGFAVALFLGDQLLLGMAWEGWIDDRQNYPGHMNAGQVGPAFLAIHGLLEPGKRDAVEEHRALRLNRDERGGAPPHGRE